LSPRVVEKLTSFHRGFASRLASAGEEKAAPVEADAHLGPKIVCPSGVTLKGSL
jgi:hypothetical protein